MGDKGPRSASEQALYDEVLAKVKSEGVIPEKSWHVVAQNLFERALIRERRHEKEKPILDDLRACGIDVESPWKLSAENVRAPGALDVLLRHAKL